MQCQKCIFNISSVDTILSVCRQDSPSLAKVTCGTLYLTKVINLLANFSSLLMQDDQFGSISYVFNLIRSFGLDYTSFNLKSMVLNKPLNMNHVYRFIDTNINIFTSSISHYYKIYSHGNIHSDVDYCKELYIFYTSNFTFQVESYRASIQKYKLRIQL